MVYHQDKIDRMANEIDAKTISLDFKSFGTKMCFRSFWATLIFWPQCSHQSILEPSVSMLSKTTFHRINWRIFEPDLETIDTLSSEY